MKISTDRLNRILNDADAAFARLRELQANIRRVEGEVAAIGARFEIDGQKPDASAESEKRRLLNEIAGLRLDEQHARDEANRAGRIRDNSIGFAKNFRDQLPTSFRQRISL